MLKALFFLLLAAQPAFAGDLTVRITGVRGATLYAARVPSSQTSVGRLTDALLRAATAGGRLQEYTGAEGGVASINNLGSAYEQVSSTESKSYGWCYRVDGFEPNLMADEYLLSGRERVIDWWYAYAHFRGGRWIAMCAPADHVPAH